MRTEMFLLMAVLLSAAPALATPTPVPTPPRANTTGVALRYKFRAGETLAYRFTSDGNGTVNTSVGQNVSVPIAEHLEAMMHMTIQSVNPSDGAATIAIAYDGVRMTPKDLDFIRTTLA